MAHNEYRIKVTTGNNASDRTIQIQLSGTKGSDARWLNLDNPDKDDFEVNATDNFTVNLDSDLGDIVKIRLRGPNSDDYWKVNKIEIMNMSKSNVCTEFIINTVITGSEELKYLEWHAEGSIPTIELDPKEYSRELFTEWKKTDNMDGRTDIKKTIKFDKTINGLVQIDKTKTDTQEHSWFIKGGYNPPSETGGYSISAGYSGSVVSSMENATKHSHSDLIHYSHSAEYIVLAGTCVVVECTYFEAGKKGTATFFNESISLEQATSLDADITVHTFDVNNPIPQKYRERS